jgi:hypothetical protein
MSPTVLSERGYEFRILTDDHPPPHVHVKHAEKGAKIWLRPVEVWVNWDFNTREMGKILSIVRENQDYLLSEWNRIHA